MHYNKNIVLYNITYYIKYKDFNKEITRTVIVKEQATNNNNNANNTDGKYLVSSYTANGLKATGQYNDKVEDAIKKIKESWKKQVFLLSRQFNSPSINYQTIMDELQKENIKFRCCCKRNR